MTQEQELLIRELKLAIESNNEIAVAGILAKSNFEFVKDESFDLGSFIIDMSFKKTVFEIQSSVNIFLAVLTKIPQLITRGVASSENCLLTKIAKVGNADLLNVAIGFLKKKYLQRYNTFFAENSINSRLNFSILFQKAALKSDVVSNILLNEAPHFKQDKSFMENLKKMSTQQKAPLVLSPLSQPTPLSEPRVSAFTPVKQNSSSHHSTQNSFQRPLNFLSPTSTSTNSPPASFNSTHSPSISLMLNTNAPSFTFFPSNQAYVAELPQQAALQNAQLNAAYHTEVQQKILFESAYQHARSEIAQLQEDNRVLKQQQVLLKNQCQHMQSQYDRSQQVGNIIFQKYVAKKKELEEATRANATMMNLNQRLSAEASRNANEQLLTTATLTLSETNVFLLEGLNNNLQRKNNQLSQKAADLEQRLSESLTRQSNMYKMINRWLAPRPTVLVPEPKTSTAMIEVINDSEVSSEQSSQAIFHQYSQSNNSILNSPSNNKLKRKEENGDATSKDEIENSNNTNNAEEVSKNNDRDNVRYKRINLQKI